MAFRLRVGGVAGWLACLALFMICRAGGQPGSMVDLKVLDGERWWAGVISESHRMPLHKATYRFDFSADNAGNQAQPLLISNLGRFIWCDSPLEFDFGPDRIVARSRFGNVISGTGGKTLREAYRYVSKTYFPPSGSIPEPLLFTHPQFNSWIELTYNQNQDAILEYAQKAVDLGFSPGVLMIDEGWADGYGNWDFARSRFEDPKRMVQVLHRLGLKVMLWVCPYITPDGAFFQDLFRNQERADQPIWVVDRNRPGNPAITQWWDGFSAVIDFTSPAGQAWFRKQLDRLVEKYGIDGFKFDGGDAGYYSAGSMLSPPRYFRSDATPNEQCEEYAGFGLFYPLNEFRATWKRGGQPIAQRLRDKEHTWEDLRKLIPGAINQGLMGYPFSCPDLIGGGEFLSFINLAEVDQELIVRAAQCHALMPMMQFSVAPWRVLDQEHLAACIAAAELHTRMGEEILALAREAGRNGEPIVRCLEYGYPLQGYADIGDEFLLGDSILVAPVLEQGARTRKVVFPEGSWKGDDGSVVRGPVVKQVSAPLSRLPWYRKVQ